jgi:hypothetical protein
LRKVKEREGAAVGGYNGSGSQDFPRGIR